MPAWSSISFFFSYWICFLAVKTYGFFKLLFYRPKSPQEIKKVLFLSTFYEHNAGFHYRVQQWANRLKAQGLEVHIQGAYNEDEFHNLREKAFHKFLIKGMWRRFKHVRMAADYDVVIVRRELLFFNDYGNLFMDKLLLKIQPNSILDFDDDLGATKSAKTERSLYGKLLQEDVHKFAATLNLYQRFTPGSSYLKNLIPDSKNGEAKDILVLPTCVNYHTETQKDYKQTNTLTFGWIGSDNNQPYLERIVTPLNNIAKDFSVQLLIISKTPWHPAEAEFPIENIRWTIAEEKSMMRKIDIGLMPLSNTPITKGKCAFKLIQYMGLGIVSAASNITVNGEIISDGTNGFLIKDEEQWEAALRNIINQKEKYSTIGKAASLQIEKHYSFDSHQTAYLQFIRKV